MTTTYVRKQVDPAPNPGLRRHHFRKMCQNGFGDQYNSYAHSMTWFHDHLYVGTTRANLHTARAVEQLVKRNRGLEVWPVEGPDDVDSLYREIDRGAQIWRYHPTQDQWHMVYKSPQVLGSQGDWINRDMGYRGMIVFQGESDPQPALYVPTWAPSRAPGSMLLRSVDGLQFEVVAEPGDICSRYPSARVLLTFKDRLLISPTGSTAQNANRSEIPVMYETRDPLKKIWKAVNTPNFDDDTNQGIFTACASDEHLYAGTFNLNGFQVWRTEAKGDPPYQWEKLLDQGAYRGPLNQCVASMSYFKGAIYIGSGIQGAGVDTENNVGPAASELIRLHPDGQWDLIVGTPRKTPDGIKTPLSALKPGFNNLFNGYFWRSEEHDGWLYVGTCDHNSLLLQWVTMEHWPEGLRRVIETVGVDTIVSHSGAELWRSHDGENWIPVTRDGFGNPFNIGIRSFVSTQYGLFVGTANPYGPRIAVKQEGTWVYQDNPQGGLEVWLGQL